MDGDDDPDHRHRRRPRRAGPRPPTPHDLAAQAARVAGEHVDPAQAITGTATTTDPTAAKAAARAYLAAAGVSGTVTLSNQGTRVTVHVTDHYQPLFLGAMGVGRLTVTGTSTASLVRAVEGTQR